MFKFNIAGISKVTRAKPIPSLAGRFGESFGSRSDLVRRDGPQAVTLGRRQVKVLLLRRGPPQSCEAGCLGLEQL
eukprot:5129732-Pyramimonas_sp.AAC.1